MTERAPTEVWISPASRMHCYVRLGKNACIATVNFPHDSPQAEVVRSALEQFYGASANTAK